MVIDETIWFNSFYAIVFQNTIGSKCPTLLLIGNKCDLEEQRKILTETGEDLARSYGASFGECSAKDGNGVDEVHFIKYNGHLV